MALAPDTSNALGLYLSVPFCRSKCTFCNFASGVYPFTSLPLYLDRLIDDLARARVLSRHRGLAMPQQVDTLYFGGGTPSILSPALLSSIMHTIRRHFELTADAEITLEAAPAMLDDELLTAAAALGVTRISFGVQTFIDAEARAIGRLHTAAQALDDIARARRAGLAVSIDLIAGLPGQNEASWRHSLAVLNQAAPEHASIYMLEVDDDSRLGREMLLGGTRYGAALTPSDDTIGDFYTEACAALSAQGLTQYEISNFASPGHQSRHNLRYWQRRPYLGVGLDAHSMLRDSAGGAVRFGSTDELPAYLEPHADADSWGELNRLSRAEELEEAWFLGLRTNAGVSLAALSAEFGPAAIAAFDPVLATLAADNLIQCTSGFASLTGRGRLLSNEVFAALIDIADQADPRELAAAAR